MDNRIDHIFKLNIEPFKMIPSVKIWCSLELKLEAKYERIKMLKTIIMENFKERFDNLIIDKLSVEKNQIIPNARFMNELGADSLDMVELVIEFEKEFKVSIPDAVAEEIKTVSQAENYILNLLNKNEIK